MQQDKLILAKYNALDSAVTRQCYDALAKEAYETGYADTIEDIGDLCDVLLYLQTRGILINKDALADVKKEVSGNIDSLQSDLDEACGYELNVNSPKQCMQYFYGFLGLAPYVSRTTGNPTTDDKAMGRIARKEAKGSKEAKLVQRLRGLKKLYGTYLMVIIDDDGRVRSSFDPRGTTTGRISSSQTIFGTGMNFQNIDPRFKRFMVADDKCIMFEIDKAQAEWVVTAYVSGDGDMIHVVESGQDAHVYTGHKISNLPIEVILKEGEKVGHETDPILIEAIRRKYLPELFDDTYERVFLPRIFSIRQAGKKSNHGLNYKMWYPRFALENEMQEREAKPIVVGYRDAYPGLVSWWGRIEKQLMEDRTLHNCYGDKRRFLGALDYNTIEQAIAYIPQSTVGKIINQGLVAIYADNEDYMYNIDLLNQIHDSILSQYGINDWTNMAKAIFRIRGYINPTLKYEGREFQIRTDLKVGLNWGQYDADNNPDGMVELEISDNITELADRLESYYVKAAA